jgi:heme/copper-type cytochrome/quinol oxidase subunit 2
LSITRPRFAALPLTLAAVLWAQPGQAADPVALVLKDHKFTPSEVTVPAGVRFKIQLTNQDETPAELESSDLRVEKIAAPGVTITVNAGPLKPGTYKFFDDYHPDLATGTVTAKE